MEQTNKQKNYSDLQNVRKMLRAKYKYGLTKNRGTLVLPKRERCMPIKYRLQN